MSFIFVFVLCVVRWTVLDLAPLNLISAATLICDRWIDSWHLNLI